MILVAHLRMTTEFIGWRLGGSLVRLLPQIFTGDLYAFLPLLLSTSATTKQTDQAAKDEV